MDMLSVLFSKSEHMGKGPTAMEDIQSLNSSARAQVYGKPRTRYSPDS